MAIQADDAARQHLTDLVDQLRQARKAHGNLTQAYLADLLGVATGSVLDWEAGRDNPTMINLVRWAAVLKLYLEITDRAGNTLEQPFTLATKYPWALHELHRIAFTLRNARVTAGLSQASLAATLGMNRATLVQWELVKANPRPIGLIAWSHALDAELRLQ